MREEKHEELTLFVACRVLKVLYIYMAGLVEGALVGFAVTKLFDAIIVGLATAKAFKPTLKRMKLNITWLKPEIERREKLLEDHGRGAENKVFAELLDEGTELVKRCSNVGFWNLYYRRKYSKSLTALEQSISGYCGLVIAVHTNTVALETLNVVKHLSKRTDRCTSSGRIYVNDTGLGFSISGGLHNPPKHTFGLEIPLEELKLKLLDDEVKVLLVCGHGGCGKTTLAKKLCEDSKIKGKLCSTFFCTVQTFCALHLSSVLYRHLANLKNLKIVLLITTIHMLGYAIII